MPRRVRQRIQKTQRKYHDPRWSWAKLHWYQQDGPIVVKTINSAQAYQLIWEDEVWLFNQSTGRFEQLHLEITPPEFYGKRYYDFLDDCTPKEKIEWFDSLVEAEASMNRAMAQVNEDSIEKKGDEQLKLFSVSPHYRSPYDHGH